MGKKKGIKERKLSWYMKAPIRFLAKARDLYVNGMNRYSPHFNSVDTSFGVPAAHPIVLPRSFSAGAAASSSASDDYRELLRANSVPYRQSGRGLDLSPQKQAPAPAKVSKMTVPRSRSIGIGRIDEDKPCEYEDDFKTKPSVPERSRSYVVRTSAGVRS